MSEQFHEVLSATIDHLQALKMRGAQFVALEAETVRALNGVAPRNNGAARPQQTAVVEQRITAPAPQPLTAPSAPNSPAIDAPIATSVASKAQAMAELRERAL